MYCQHNNTAEKGHFLTIFFFIFVSNVADPGSLSRIRIFSTPDPRVKKILDPGSGSAWKN